jgi:catechol 2,3-dioxygenase-like lactoylglutathione lyase family enzyme
MIQRMDNVLIVVEDLEAAKAFFAELGMELEGETTIEGPWVGPDRRAQRSPCRNHNDADPGRPRPSRAVEVPQAAGGPSRAGKRAGASVRRPGRSGIGDPFVARGTAERAARVVDHRFLYMIRLAKPRSVASRLIRTRGG